MPEDGDLLLRLQKPLSPKEIQNTQQIAPTDFHNPHGNLSKRHGHFEQIVKQGEFAQ